MKISIISGGKQSRDRPRVKGKSRLKRFCCTSSARVMLVPTLTKEKPMERRNERLAAANSQAFEPALRLTSTI